MNADSGWNQISGSVADTIGRTPLVQLRSVVGDAPATVVAKLEYFNPGGSIKDRAALAMITAAEKDGRLRSGGTLVEATSGNTGYAVAMLAAARGYRAIIICSDEIPEEKLAKLQAYGAEIVLVPADAAVDSPQHYLATAARIANEMGNAIFCNQSFNPANPEVHYRTTGPEIWEQTDGRVTTFMATAGTGGTISGVGRYLKEQNPGIEAIVADPEGSIYKAFVETGRIADPEPYLVEAAGQNEAFIPDSFDAKIVDRVVAVSDRESFAMARRLAREEGIFCGISSGTAVAAAVHIAQEKEAADLIVAVVPDAGDKYLTRLHSDDWLRANIPDLEDS